jgi:hypothetical protein
MCRSITVYRVNFCAVAIILACSKTRKKRILNNGLHLYIGKKKGYTFMRLMILSRTLMQHSAAFIQLIV